LFCWQHECYKGAKADQLCSKFYIGTVILAPLNVNDNHWVLLVADIGGGGIQVYDSTAKVVLQLVDRMLVPLPAHLYLINCLIILSFQAMTSGPSSNDTRIMSRHYKELLATPMNRLGDWLVQHLPSDVKLKKFSYIYQMPEGLPQQENCNDCGAFVVKFMERLSAGK